MLTKEVYSDGQSYTASNSLRAILFVLDSNSANCGVYILATTGIGTWLKKDVSVAENITIDITTANRITLKPASGSRRILMQILQGTISS